MKSRISGQRSAAGNRRERTAGYAQPGRVLTAGVRGQPAGFTLLEVIIACAIFFMCAFAVLEVIVGGLAAARALQQREPDAGMLAGIYSQTNILTEESASGDFDELYPESYPGYSWMRQTTEIYSNSLFQVDYAVIYAHPKRRGVSETHMSILLYKPGSPPGSASKSMGGLGGP